MTTFYILMISCVFTFLGLIPFQVFRTAFNWNGMIMFVASGILFTLGVVYANWINSRIQLNFAKTLGACCGITTLIGGIYLIIFGLIWLLPLIFNN